MSARHPRGHGGGESGRRRNNDKCMLEVRDDASPEGEEVLASVFGPKNAIVEGPGAYRSDYLQERP